LAGIEVTGDARPRASLDVLKLALSLGEEYDLREPTEIDWRTVVTVGDAAAFVFRLATVELK
jgi:hypothetical protein